MADTYDPERPDEGNAGPLEPSIDEGQPEAEPETPPAAPEEAPPPEDEPC